MFSHKNMQKLTDVYTYDPCCTYPGYIWSRPRGAQIWYKNGLFHREGDLPAVIADNGSAVYYCIDGVYHRDGDLPAVEEVGIVEAWYVHGELHRVGGPAMILMWDPNRRNECLYYQHGLLHRDERDSEGNLLPAVFYGPYIGSRFYLNGVEVNKDGTSYAV